MPGKTSIALVLSALTALCLLPAQGKNMWDINHGMTNPPMPPGFKPHDASGNPQGGGPMAFPTNQPGTGGQVQGFDNGFWKGSKQLEMRVPAGTVLTAILENNLSSRTSQPGDVFTLTLQDGFSLNGTEIIPPNSKIVGAVNFAASAASIKGGNPGRLQISLQSLVFPDGRHTQFFGTIDSNPNSAHRGAPKVKHLGHSIADYGQSLTAMGFSFVAGPGFMMGKFNRGQDFHVDKGEVLPVRLNQELEIPEVKHLVAQPPNMRGSGNMGTPYSQGTPVTTPGYLDPRGPYRIPGFVPGTANGAPFTMGQQPVDPNSVFTQPIQPNTLNQFPDPF